MTTPPLTPPDCDLRDFAFMPLDVVRLRDSELATLATGDEFRCAVLLWCASWHQIPAASLPDDDTMLAQLAGFGRVVKEWRKVRVGSLRGWIKCSDHRLYHPVVAEKAREAWRAKLKQRWMTECSRVKKHNQRHGTKHEVPEFDEWLSLNCPQGQTLDVPRDSGPLSPKTDPICPKVVPREMHSKGQGYRQGHIDKESNRHTESNRGAPPDDGFDPKDLPDDFVPETWEAWRIWFEAEHGLEHDPYSQRDRKKFRPLATAWVVAAVSLGQMRRAITKAKTESTEPIAYLPAYVDSVLATMQRPAKPPTQSELNTLAAGFATGVYGPAAFDPVPQPSSEFIDVDTRLIAP